MKQTLFLFLFSALLQSASAQQTLGLFLNDSLSQNGYTLWTPNKSTYLIDNCGRLINSWQHTSMPGLSAYLLEDGSLLRAGKVDGDFNGPGVGGRIEKIDWDGTVIWSYDYASVNHQQHHDIEPMPNGHVLLVAWELQSPISATEAGAAIGRDYWALHIVELQPLGSDDAQVVWEWHIWDHLIQDFDATKANFGVVAEHPELMDINFNPPGGGFGGEDWMHVNSIHYNAARDEILISSRDMHEVYIIDHSTTSEEAAGHQGGLRGRGGDFLYRWGNPKAYGRGNSAVQQFFGQHDARWMADDKVMVFNNGLGRPDGDYSTVDIIQLPLNPQGDYVLENGQSYGPSNLSVRYKADVPESFFSSTMSGAHPLPNGNVFICDALRSSFFEVTPTGKKVWEYVNPVGLSGPMAQGSDSGQGIVFRGTRYPENYAAFDGKSLEPGELIELNPLPSDCVIYQTSVALTPTPSALEGIRVRTNPLSDWLLVENKSGASIEWTILDIDGRVLLSESSRDSLLQYAVGNWARGIYVVRALDKKAGRLFHQKIILH